MRGLSLILYHHSMDHLQHEALCKMFAARRLQPNIPEHALFIEAELAKMKVLEPHDYKGFKEFYDRVKEEYTPPTPIEHRTAGIPETVVAKVEEKVEEKKEEPKKKGRPKVK